MWTRRQGTESEWGGRGQRVIEGDRADTAAGLTSSPDLLCSKVLEVGLLLRAPPERPVHA